MRIIRNLFVLIISLVTSVNLFAQSPVSIGVKGGINISDVHNIDNNVKVGFNIGVTAELDLPSNFFLLSGLELTTKGFKGKEVTGIIAGEIPNEYTGKATYNAMYIQLPLHAGYKLNLTSTTKLLFSAGPYLAYGVGGKRSWDVKEIKNLNFFRDDTNRFDYGIGAAVGVEFMSKINVSLGADHGFGKVFKNTETKNRCAHISLGYKF